MAAEERAMSTSRRAFLRTLGLAGAAGAVASMPEARASSSENEFVTVLDIGSCIGCGACVEACHEASAGKYPDPRKPYPKMYPSRVKVAEWSDKRDVVDRLTPYNWLFLQHAEVQYQDKTYELSIPRRCLHCTNPPCANLCPWGAARKQRNGIVRIDEEICLGGAKCADVCPWSIPQRQTGVGLYLDLLPSFAGNGVMYKCDRCYDRVERGGVPACIEACPVGAQRIGPRREMIAYAHQLCEQTNGFLYGEIENGGTNTLYVSPVPFDLINEAVEKGPGKPHMAPVENQMETAENLSWALLAAPLAGAAAGLLKTGTRLLKASESPGGERENTTAMREAGTTTARDEGTTAGPETGKTTASEAHDER